MCKYFTNIYACCQEKSELSQSVGLALFRIADEPRNSLAFRVYGLSQEDLNRTRPVMKVTLGMIHNTPTSEFVRIHVGRTNKHVQILVLVMQVHSPINRILASRNWYCTNRILVENNPVVLVIGVQ